MVRSGTFNFEKNSVHPCPEVHQHWKFGEIHSGNFQDIAFTTHRSLFSSILDPPWPLILTFRPKIWCVHPCAKYTNADSDENMSSTFQDIVLTTFWMHGRTDARTNCPKTCLWLLYVGGGIKVIMEIKLAYSLRNSRSTGRVWNFSCLNGPGRAEKSTGQAEPNNSDSCTLALLHRSVCQHCDI